MCNCKWKEIESFAKRVMYRVQLHSKCTFTCFKSKIFCCSCRLAKPSAQIEATKFSQLRTRKNKLDEIIKPMRDSCIDPPPPIGYLNFPSKDTRVLWCDHQRLNATDANLVDGNIALSASLG